MGELFSRPSQTMFVDGLGIYFGHSSVAYYVKSGHREILRISGNGASYRHRIAVEETRHVVNKVLLGKRSMRANSLVVFVDGYSFPYVPLDKSPYA